MLASIFAVRITVLLEDDCPQVMFNVMVGESQAWASHTRLKHQLQIFASNTGGGRIAGTNAGLCSRQIHGQSKIRLACLWLHQSWAFCLDKAFINLSTILVTKLLYAGRFVGDMSPAAGWSCNASKVATQWTHQVKDVHGKVASLQYLLPCHCHLKSCSLSASIVIRSRYSCTCWLYCAQNDTWDNALCLRSCSAEGIIYYV